MREVWQQIKTEDIYIVRCTVEQLMRQYGLQGDWHGKGKITTTGRDDQKRTDELVNRNFSAHRLTDFEWLISPISKPPAAKCIPPLSLMCLPALSLAGRFLIA